MKFLIQHNQINPKNLFKIKDALMVIPHEFVGVIPFSHEIISNDPFIGDNYIPYGSTLLTTLANEMYNWKGLHFDLSRFTYVQAKNNRNDMLNCDMILSLKHAVNFLENEKKGTDWFIRPSEDMKHFSGIVMEAHEASEWLKDCMECESSGTYKLDPEMFIVLSQPRNIQAEWRWFVIDGKIVDGSMYRCRGQLTPKKEENIDCIKEAQKFADIWLPDSCVCMDLALVDDEMKVIEFNCINSSGFYDNDIDKIFRTWYDFEKGRI